MAWVRASVSGKVVLSEEGFMRGLSLDNDTALESQEKFFSWKVSSSGRFGFPESVVQAVKAAQAAKLMSIGKSLRGVSIGIPFMRAEVMSTLKMG